MVAQYFWNLFISSSLEPTPLMGFMGFGAMLLVAVAIAYLLFRREDLSL